MKLRCTHNSIRLRLKKSDIQELVRSQKVSVSISFGSNAVLYCTLALADSSDISAKYINNNIFIILPESVAKTWINSNLVGIEETLSLDNQETLHILIEKDFPCLDRENEDQSDTFNYLAEKKDIC